MKKKILFVINSLTIGGSEKSLVSLLNLIDLTIYDVDLMMFKKGGEFDKDVPKEVNILEEPEYYKFVAKDLKSKDLSLKDNINYRICRLKTTFNLRKNLMNSKKRQTEQILYKSQRNALRKLEKEYDVAIAYSQGMPTYFVVDFVNSKRKIAWINCDYVNTQYDKDLDYRFYKKVDKIVVVSKAIRESIAAMKPEYDKKMNLILDIVNPNIIKNMANQGATVFHDKSVVNILTVARLISHYKGYITAIKAAKLLKDNNYKFKWYAVGEGEDRKEIETFINDLGMNEEFILLGKKENPYPYMKNCDIYVQPSKKEGFGLTVIEAKVLKRPIVCTNFNTADELINNEVDGLVVGHNEQDIFLGIKRYLDDINFKNNILKTLMNEKPYSSVGEIDKIYKLIS
ncbi:glycosyltransferase [Bacillus sp. OK048]|uniref:glycosyltransferase n=1 Tax=Bacillus sp. OK048 TaxID=1882761 RepID=UPI00087FFAA2|nr:glycosyltransferase [Bacillus sp. OK048]SDM78263.1 Glycosyltransferase involved in cell wall bisynthesis [Bacillus sp. OK048]